MGLGHHSMKYYFPVLSNILSNTDRAASYLHGNIFQSTHHNFIFVFPLSSEHLCANMGAFMGSTLSPHTCPFFNDGQLSQIFSYCLNIKLSSFKNHCFHKHSLQLQDKDLNIHILYSNILAYDGNISIFSSLL